MGEVATKNKDIRESILQFEDALKSVEGALIGDNEMCPLKHSFADGIYVREIFIPKGAILTGKIHSHEHPNVLLKGKVRVFTESAGFEILEAPMAMISKAGTKRIIEVLEDCTWITYHSNISNTQDLEKIEKFVISETYEDYTKLIESQNSLKSKLINKIKKWIA